MSCCTCNITPCTCPNVNCACPPTFTVDPATIPCPDSNPCEDSMDAACVFYTGTAPIPCYNIVSGDSLETALQKIGALCPTGTNTIAAVLLTILGNQDLSNIFCQIVSACLNTGGTTPQIISVIIT